MNLRYFPKGIISTTTLPIWHAFSIRQGDKFLVKCVALQEGVAPSDEVRQQNNVQIIARSESFLATNIKQGRNLGKPVFVNIDGVAGESDKVLISDCLVSGQLSAVTLIVQIQQVHSLNA